MRSEVALTGFWVPEEPGETLIAGTQTGITDITATYLAGVAFHIRDIRVSERVRVLVGGRALAIQTQDPIFVAGQAGIQILVAGLAQRIVALNTVKPVIIIASIHAIALLGLVSPGCNILATHAGICCILTVFALGSTFTIAQLTVFHSPGLGCRGNNGIEIINIELN